MKDRMLLKGGRLTNINHEQQSERYCGPIKNARSDKIVDKAGHDAPHDGVVHDEGDENSAVKCVDMCMIRK